VKSNKCIVCETRPQKNGVYCGLCAAKIAAENRATEERKNEARYYIAYRGIVVGLYPKGEEDGQTVYRSRLERVDVEDLPKSRVLNLDGYLRGYTREQVKKFKRACLSLSGSN